MPEIPTPSPEQAHPEKAQQVHEREEQRTYGDSDYSYDVLSIGDELDNSTEERYPHLQLILNINIAQLEELKELIIEYLKQRQGNQSNGGGVVVSFLKQNSDEYPDRQVGNPKYQPPRIVLELITPSEDDNLGPDLFVHDELTKLALEINNMLPDGTNLIPQPPLKQSDGFIHLDTNSYGQDEGSNMRNGLFYLLTSY